MTPSIRTFLLINLLLSVTLITSLAIVGNLFLAHKDIQAELDAQLNRTTFRILAFISYKPGKQNLSLIQEKLNSILANSKATSKDSSSEATKMEKTLEFQAWSKQGRLLLKSPGAPSTPFTKIGQNTLQEVVLNHSSWRVNSYFSPKNKLTIMVADRSNYRQHLENQLTQDSVFIMLITYPFLGLLIWIIVGRGLHALETVAKEVKHRDPSYLEPVNMDTVPSEVEPLVLELNELFSRLKGAFERHERFTADAAHELKTPLAALSAHAQVAIRSESPEDRNEALLKVLGGVNRCTHVVQQLLTFSRMCPEAGINDPDEINLTNLATEIAAMLAPEAIAKNIELELVNPDCKAIIVCNSTAIAILIRNLVDNAIRYSPENSDVKIILSTQPEHVTLQVIDNGPGIPEELRNRVFERFFRVIGNRTTGSGLGLGIVQQIVKLHNATIDLLTPESNTGLEVKVILPKNPLNLK